MKKLADQLGTVHSFKTTPKRIISLVPSQTELLYDLGLENTIIGITKFCIHPAHLKETKKIVGGTKQVHFEKIKLLKPDVIICNKEENTLEIVAELQKICPVWVTNIVTIEDNLKMIADFGQIFNCKSIAQKWADKLVFSLNDFQQFLTGKPVGTLKKKVAYFIWKNPFMVVGSNNFINELLKLNHFDNSYETLGRYPVIDLKNLPSDGTLDLVLLSSEPYPFKEEDALEIGQFTNNVKTIFVDGEMFSWYGSRLIKAFEYFKVLHSTI